MTEPKPLRTQAIEAGILTEFTPTEIGSPNYKHQIVKSALAVYEPALRQALEHGGCHCASCDQLKAELG